MNHNHYIPAAADEYPRSGFVVAPDGAIVWYFDAHPDIHCDICEFPFSNERLHPRDPAHPNLNVLCDGNRIRLPRAVK